MKEPLVSVIVPVYNTEAYLKECVDSIVNQTYQNLEIILVDDGATDNCPKICDEYALEDQRVRVIHKENAGASKARESAILVAAGNYIMFVDSDDWLELETIQRCVEVAEKNKSECVLFGYIKEYTGKQILNPLFDKNLHFIGSEAEDKIHRRLIGYRAEELGSPEKIDNLSTLWGKLYTAEIAKKGRIISEREVGTSEDTIFNIYALEGCSSISYINQCFYHYRKSNCQAMTMQYKPELYEKWKKLYKIFEEYIAQSEKQELYQKVFLNRVACGMIGLGINEAMAVKGVLEKSRRIKLILNDALYKKAFQELDYSCCPIKWTLFFLMCKKQYAFPLCVMLEIIIHIRMIYQ